MKVSFDDWENPPSESNPALLVPTIVTSTPTNTLETVQEQSVPSSPMSPSIIKETSFPYTPRKGDKDIVRSLELEFNDQKESVEAPLEEKEPPRKDLLGNHTVVNEPLGSLPIKNNLVEIPIDFESQGNSDSVNEEATTKSDSVVVTDGNTRQVLERTLDFSNSRGSLSNSVDSGLHISTDQLLSQVNKELGDKVREDLDTRNLGLSQGRNETPRDTEDDGELRIGQVITVGDSKIGSIRYIGTTEFASGDWVGVELQLPVGKYVLGSLSKRRF